jgi:hypothetical protein
MVAQLGWRHLWAACGIVTAIAVTALSASGLSWMFGFGQAGATSHPLTDPRHNPAGYSLPATALDPLLRGRKDGRTALARALIRAIKLCDRRALRPDLARRGYFAAKEFQHDVRIPLAIRRSGLPDPG